MHAEIDRLPDRHRLPVVLCDLEGLSYEQAASTAPFDRAGAPLPAVQGAKRLRDRLTRRGVTATALTVAMVHGGRCGGGGRSPLGRSRRVAAATGGASTATALALSQTILRAMLMTRLKVAAIALLAAAGIVSAGVVVNTTAARRPQARDERASHSETIGDDRG